MEVLVQPVIVFDVMETLLNLAPLDRHFARAFGKRAARQTWFAQMLQIAMTMTITGVYEDFSRVADAALTMTAQQLGTKISAADRKAIRGQIASLPAHADVASGLQRLQESGFRLAALTNSTAKVARHQLTNAGVAASFEQILSVDSIQRFKPAAETYQWAAKQLDVGTSDVMLVAAHGWDVAGAMAAGCRAAFLRRPGKALSTLQNKPEIITTDLHSLATRLRRTMRAA